MKELAVPLSEAEYWLMESFAKDKDMTPEAAAAEIIAACVELHQEDKRERAHGRH
jgi:hypothetical protein